MRIFDRIYGEITFPEIIGKLLDCPALLRLRDVRMANNQFAAFPAFSNSSRYEHSIGVCYLAGICAKSLMLPTKDTIELMMASLYHDVGTPPFAHAMEEVLQAKYGFDHEENLRCLIEGRNSSFAGTLDQVYLGGTIKLRSVCQSKGGQKLGLDIYRIAKLIVGDKSEPLSALLNGNGIDLDNIDNVVRASSAMGIIGPDDYSLATRLARNVFIITESGEVQYNVLSSQDIKRWQTIRDAQYTAIFDSTEDFAYQTMIKKCLNILINSDTEQKLSVESWKHTDSSILYKNLLIDPSTKPIIERVLLYKPFRCIGLIYVSGDNVVSYINKNLELIEETASRFYDNLMHIEKDKKTNGLNSVVANFYPDKRKRPIYTTTSIMGVETKIDNGIVNAKQGAILGLFTPTVSDKYVTVVDSKGKRMRKLASFTNSDLNDLLNYLHSSALKEFEVELYGNEENTVSNQTTRGDQLGFL